MDPLQHARKALRIRQGAGARWDAPSAPAETLRFARMGTAYFARLLNEMTEETLDGPCLVPGWTRRHIIALVGYQARALTRLTEWAASGVRNPLFAAPRQRLAEIEDGATLPDRALRGLFHHAAVHLDVEWRDLKAQAWDVPLALPDGTVITARDTPWLRARELWLRAVDLGTTGSFLDFPDGVVDRLLPEAASGWSGQGCLLVAVDRKDSIPLGDSGGPAIRGTAADLARWATGRGARRLLHDGPLPAHAPDLKR